MEPTERLAAPTIEGAMDTRKNAIRDVIKMLDEQIKGITDEVAGLIEAVEELTEVRELTSGLLGPSLGPGWVVTTEEPDAGVNHKPNCVHNVSFREDKVAASVSKKLYEGALVVGEAMFTYEQRNWAAIYRLMLDGMSYIGDMETATTWSKQRVRDCLRGLREMGLVVKGPNNDSQFYLADDTPNALTSSDVVVAPKRGHRSGKPKAYEFSPRQWRWEDAHKMVSRGCRTSKELAKRLGHGWTVKQASGLLYQLRKLGLIEKRGKRGWAITDREAVYWRG